MQTINFGALGLNWRGAYDSNIAYTKLDFLSYDGSVHICKSSAPVGTLPTDSTYFDIMMPSANIASVGDGEYLFLDKDNTSDAAGSEYQLGGSARARAGIIGDDDYRIQVSPDGSVFYDGIVIDKDTGEVSFPNNHILSKDKKPVIYKSSGSDDLDYSRSWTNGAADVANIGPAITSTPSVDAERLLINIQVSWAVNQTGTDNDAHGALSLRYEDSVGAYNNIAGTSAFVGYVNISGGALYGIANLVGEVSAGQINTAGDWNISLSFDPSDDGTSGFGSTFTIYNIKYILQEVLNDQ